MKHTSREIRRKQVCDIVANRPYATTLEIARELHLTKSPHLIGIIDELVADGVLAYTEDTMPNGALVRRWLLCDHLRQFTYLEK